jgi:hypothetical protein
MSVDKGTPDVGPPDLPVADDSVMFLLVASAGDGGLALIDVGDESKHIDKSRRDLERGSQGGGSDGDVDCVWIPFATFGIRHLHDPLILVCVPRRSTGAGMRV